jgi:polar amino acid transport system substrate-binding protein
MCRRLSCVAALLCSYALLSPLLTCEEITLGSDYWPILSDGSLADGGQVTKTIRNAYLSVGITVKRIEIPWSRILASVLESPAPIAGGYPFGKTTEREALYLFSDAVGSATRYVYYNVAKPFAWETIEDMRGMRIGIVRGAVFGAYHEQLMAKIKEHPDFATIDPAKDELTNFMKLAGGRIDICFCDETQAEYAIAKLPAADQAKIRAAKKPIMERAMLYVLFRKDPRGKRLCDALNAGLRNLDRTKNGQ